MAIRRLRYLAFIVALAFVAVAARADNCAICGQPITGTIYLMTDQVTGQQIEVCTNCLKLPRCFICGLPVKDGVQLPDGRWLCARDAKTAVMDVGEVQDIFDQVHDDLDKQYARFTLFPTNIYVSVIDRVDVDSMFQLSGNVFENPNVLGVTQPYNISDDIKRYKISLLTGQPRAQLEEVCAHELSHAWVGENVSPERHARIARDTEEGFCEMMGYLYVDSKGDEIQKQRVMANNYTRGQVKLFVAAEQQYGFESILDWMRYGVDSELEDGHLDRVLSLQMPDGTVTKAPAPSTAVYARGSLPPSEPSTLQLQGIMWGAEPSAIINGHSFFAGDQAKVSVGHATETIRCLRITRTTVQVQNVDTEQQQQLNLR